MDERTEVLLREARVALDRALAWLAMLPAEVREAEVRSAIERLGRLQ